MLTTQDTEDSTVFVVGYVWFFVILSVVSKALVAALNLETVKSFFLLVFFCCAVTKETATNLPYHHLLEYGFLLVCLKQQGVLLELWLVWNWLVFTTDFFI